MIPLSRRDYLVAAGTTVSSVGGGCSGLGQVQDEPPTLQSGDRYPPDDQPALRVSNPAVHRSVVTTEQVSHHTYKVVDTPSTGQYLVVRVGTIGIDSRPADLPLHVFADGASNVETKKLHVGGEDSRRIGFHMPQIDAEEVVVVWERDGATAHWKLDVAVVEKLSAVPEFTVRSWNVPTSVERGSTFEASVTVENTGDRDGRFLAEFDADMGSLPLGEVSTTVQAGKTKTATFLLRPRTYGDIDEFPVVLDWGAGRRTQSVSVTES